MPDFVCPKCGSDRLRRSHTRGVSERLKKLMGWRAYRCREQSCGWRGLLKTKSFGEGIAKAKNRNIQILILILVVAVISIGIFLVIHLSK